MFVTIVSILHEGQCNYLTDEYVLHEATFGGRTDDYLFQSGEDVCEGHRYNWQQCASFGCCTFDGGACWSSVGGKPCGLHDDGSLDEGAAGKVFSHLVNDHIIEQRVVPIEFAASFCNDQPGCVGFTFEGRVSDMNAKRNIFFMKVADVGRSGWTSYIHKGVQTTPYDPSKHPLKRFRGSLASLKSEPVPDEDSLYDGGVMNVVGSTFKSVTQDRLKDVLVSCYASWCGYCQKFRPVYRQLARNLRHVATLQIAQLDAPQNTVQDIKISAFPTILFFPAGDRKDQPLRYTGKREVKDLTHWLHEHATYGNFSDTPTVVEEHDEVEGIIGDSEDL